MLGMFWDNSTEKTLQSLKRDCDWFIKIFLKCVFFFKCVIYTLAGPTCCYSTKVIKRPHLYYITMCVWFIYWDMETLDKMKQSFIIWCLQYLDVYVYFGGHFENCCHNAKYLHQTNLEIINIYLYKSSANYGIDLTCNDKSDWHSN